MVVMGVLLVTVFKNLNFRVVLVGGGPCLPDSTWGDHSHMYSTKLLQLGEDFIKDLTIH